MVRLEGYCPLQAESETACLSAWVALEITRKTEKVPKPKRNRKTTQVSLTLMMCSLDFLNKALP